VRLSIGIEDVRDLIEDLDRAFAIARREAATIEVKVGGAAVSTGRSGNPAVAIPTGVRAAGVALFSSP